MKEEEEEEEEMKKCKSLRYFAENYLEPKLPPYALNVLTAIDDGFELRLINGKNGKFIALFKPGKY